MSDGDNLQWLQSGWATDPQWWGAPGRGSVPVGWTFSPAALELLPPVLDYVLATLTPNDELVGAPSGSGYAYPGLLPSDGARSAFANASGGMLRAAFGRPAVLNVIGAAPSRESIAALAAQPEVSGLLYYTYGDGYSGLRGNVAYVGGTPVVGGRVSLWGDATEGDMVGVDGLVQALQTLPKDPKDPNAYSIIPVNAWSHNYSTIATAVDRLTAIGGFNVVTPSVLLDRLKTDTDMAQQCPMPSGPWSASCLGCTFSGNGTCILACDDCAGSSAQCDLATCDDLEFDGGKGRFVCTESGELCPSE